MTTVRPPAPVLPPTPVTTPADAVRLVAAITGLRPGGPPGTEEIVSLVLDRHGVGGVALAVSDAPTPAAVLRVAEIAGRIAAGQDTVAHLVVASVRAADSPAERAADLDRWRRLDEGTGADGVVLVDWLVVTPARVRLPRVAAGAPSRWPLDAGPG